MKFLINTIYKIAAGIVLFFIASYIFLWLYGRPIIIGRIEELTGKKVTIGYFDITPPLNLRIKDLNIEGLVNIDDILVSPSIIQLLSGNLAFNRIKILSPEITIERRPQASPTQQPAPAAVTAAKPAPAGAVSQASVTPKAVKKRPPHLIIKRLIIRRGSINLIDYTVKDGIKITAKDLNFNLSNFYPSSAVANFSLDGKIPWQEGQSEGRIEAEGWMNFAKKDMRATLKVLDIDGIYLYPYYSNWVDLEKARIEKATLNFTSNLHSLNNELVADCRIELSNIVRKPRAPEEPQQRAEKITNAVLDMFKGMDQGNIVLTFSFKTRMDAPNFGFGKIKMAFESKLAQARDTGGGLRLTNIVVFPARLVESTVRSATDLSKAVIEGTFAVGNEFKKAVEDTFGKPKK